MKDENFYLLCNYRVVDLRRGAHGRRLAALVGGDVLLLLRWLLLVRQGVALRTWKRRGGAERDFPVTQVERAQKKVNTPLPKGKILPGKKAAAMKSKFCICFENFRLATARLTSKITLDDRWMRVFATVLSFQRSAIKPRSVKRGDIQRVLSPMEGTAAGQGLGQVSASPALDDTDDCCRRKSLYRSSPRLP